MCRSRYRTTRSRGSPTPPVPIRRRRHICRSVRADPAHILRQYALVPDRDVRARDVLVSAWATRDLRSTIFGLVGLGSLLVGVVALELRLVLVGVGLLAVLVAFAVPLAWIEVVRERDPNRSFGWTDVVVIVPLAVVAAGCLVVAVTMK